MSQVTVDYNQSLRIHQRKQPLKGRRGCPDTGAERPSEWIQITWIDRRMNLSFTLAADHRNRGWRPILVLFRDVERYFDRVYFWALIRWSLGREFLVKAYFRSLATKNWICASRASFIPYRIKHHTACWNSILICLPNGGQHPRLKPIPPIQSARARAYKNGPSQHQSFSWWLNGLGSTHECKIQRNGTNLNLCPVQQNTMRGYYQAKCYFRSSHLSRSDWISIRYLSKAWLVIAAKHVIDEIRVGRSDQALLSLRALSNYKYLRVLEVRLSNICSDKIRLYSQCWGWPPSSEAILPGVRHDHDVCQQAAFC